MGVNERKKLIKSLEATLGSRLLVIVTGDRQGMETKIAPDILPLVSEHLSQIGTTEQISLFIYTPGGDPISGWGIVNLIREYCKKFKAIIPFRSLSCGTLIALGADEIIMGRHGLLSPIDPSVSSPFNPPYPGTEKSERPSLLPVSVEDMVGFLDLATKEIFLKSDEVMVQVLGILANKVHPLALGAVYRSKEQISTLARRLLQKHMSDEAKINRIVKRLTQELPTHSYLIGRKEAFEDIELHIAEIDDETADLMWQLYKEYENWLKLTGPVSAELDLGKEENKIVRYERAAIESLRGDKLYQHVFITDKELFRIKTRPPNALKEIEQTMERIIYQGWIAQEDGEAM